MVSALGFIAFTIVWAAEVVKEPPAAPCRLLLAFTSLTIPSPTPKPPLHNASFTVSLHLEGSMDVKVVWAVETMMHR